MSRSTCRSHPQLAVHAQSGTSRPQASSVRGDLGYIPPEYTADPVERCRALVLDSSYRPINVRPAGRTLRGMAILQCRFILPILPCILAMLSANYKEFWLLEAFLAYKPMSILASRLIVGSDWQLTVHAHLQVVNWQRAIILDYAEKVGLCLPRLKHVLCLHAAVSRQSSPCTSSGCAFLSPQTFCTSSQLILLHAHRWTCSSTTTQLCSQHAQSTSSQLS